MEARVLDFLAFLLINFSLPFLAFSRIIENFKVAEAPSLGIFLLISLAIFMGGLFLGLAFPLGKEKQLKREFISMVSFQNCGYLPLNIAIFLFSGKLQERMIIYTFLYILGFDMIMWSVGSFYIFKRKEERFNFKSLFTPPIVGTLLGLLLVSTNLKRFFPTLLLTPLKMIGEVSFVLSMLVLGGWLARVELVGFFQRFFLLLEASFLKLVVLPLFFLILLGYFKVSSLLGFFIILQASMPSAVSLPIVVNLRKADSVFVSQGVFLTHLFSILSVPFWLSLYLRISDFSF